MSPRQLPDDLVLGEHVVLHGEVRIGRGCRIEDGAIIGRVPRLSRNSSAPHTGPEPTTLEDGAAVCAGAIVFAGARICAGAIVGDQAHVRERAVLGPESVLGRGSALGNDAVVGARVRIQTNVWLTSSTVVEDDVFVGPGVVTTNDDEMSPWAAARPAAPAGAATGLQGRRGRRPHSRSRDRRGGVRSGRRGRHE